MGIISIEFYHFARSHQVIPLILDSFKLQKRPEITYNWLIKDILIYGQWTILETSEKHRGQCGSLCNHSQTDGINTWPVQGLDKHTRQWLWNAIQIDEQPNKFDWYTYRREKTIYRIPFPWLYPQGAIHTSLFCI